VGTFRESGAILLSNEMAGFHFDANFIVTEETESGARRAQYAQTLSVSHPLKKFTISGEIWHFTQPFFASNAVGTLWFDHGFTSTSTHWEEFVGFTYLLPHRLWRRDRTHA
jgi:hypothetical protein